MRLLWVGTNPGGGGTETHMITLSQALVGIGAEVHAVAHPQGRIAAALLGTGVVLHPGQFRNSADPGGVRAVQSALRHTRPDWVVGSFSKEYWPLALLSRAQGVPLALFRHMDLRLRPSTRWLLSRWPLRLFAISAYLRGRLIAQGLPEGRVEVLPNPLHLADFQRDTGARAERRQALGLRKGDFLVAFVGAWHRGKGVFLLADAIDAAHAQDARVQGLWIGGGAHETELRARLADRPWQHVMGWQERVTPWYSVMDALALPSIEPDTFGRVCLEAQACATPVLGAAMGGIPESFADGVTGLLLPPGNSDAWRDALLRLVGDPTLRQQLAAAGPAHAERFDADAIARDFLAALGR
ncbi:glycosyltransferase family 4 protein [Acidithiobacillus sulfuriphilus]|uniref:Glycosyltransferase family 1 protein n=2 Tax=Acidithiobacillus sulfuriphilus TaxID=1867749 RepID=A0A3M8QNQ0_9PROT|nr:glycosyltransferase family 4 protein [Acidithiobacillus sulfuriphilus]RNF57893.1 glycosyltransferase family 1 protein [Acidithiobacillus sulfuriphilus]